VNHYDSRAGARSVQNQSPTAALSCGLVEADPVGGLWAGCGCLSVFCYLVRWSFFVAENATKRSDPPRSACHSAAGLLLRRHKCIDSVYGAESSTR
jgi:hypothetical protein